MCVLKSLILLLECSKIWRPLILSIFCKPCVSARYSPESVVSLARLEWHVCVFKSLTAQLACSVSWITCSDERHASSVCPIGPWFHPLCQLKSNVSMSLEWNVCIQVVIPKLADLRFWNGSIDHRQFHACSIVPLFHPSYGVRFNASAHSRLQKLVQIVT